MSRQTKSYLLLHILLIFFSAAPVCAKLAGQKEFMSLPFLFYYGVSVAILGIYALVWQQIIKGMPLTAAYANRAVTVVWGIVWGVAFFGEKPRLPQVLGAGIIIAGVILYAFGQGKENA